MALLQISEPGKSLAPHQRRIAVGIDLGTTNSLVAIVRDAENYYPQSFVTYQTAELRQALKRLRV